LRLIITRPEEDAHPLQQKLEALGHSASIVSLFEIVPYTDISVLDRPYQATCITSANGLRSTSLPDEMKRLPILTLGPQSAAQAKKSGFADIRTGGGNVNGLTQFITENLRPENGPLLYLSGKETSGDLEGQLRARGFDVDRVIAYDAKPAKPDLSLHLKTADAVMLYSPRSALLWTALMQAQAHSTSSLTHLCLSASVAAKLPAGVPTKIAKTATEDGMLALLEPAGNVE
jgi:uroporphyrinogen-III synthase